jgi:hypothetical protein
MGSSRGTKRPRRRSDSGSARGCKLGQSPAAGTHNGHSFRVRSNAVRQSNRPSSLALVHSQDDTGVTGRMVAGRIKQEKAGAELGHGHGVPIENKTNPDVSGVAAVTAGLEIDE